MAALVGGETRKRTNTGSSMDDCEEDRVILLEPDGTMNVTLDSDASDDNQGANIATLNKTYTVYNKIERLKGKRLSMPMCRTPRHKKLWMALCVAVLGAILLLMVAIPLGLWSERPQESCSDLIDAKEFAPYIFDPNKRGKFALCHNRESLLEGALGINRSYYKHDRVNLYEYEMSSLLDLSRPSVDDENCVRVKWTGTASVEHPLIDCFDMCDSNNVCDDWFGGYETLVQNWPINGDSRTTTMFVPRDYSGQEYGSDFGPILHPVWLSSKGVVISVDEDVPLHVSVNESGDQRLCLKSVPHSLKCIPGVMEETTLSYTVCGFENISRAAVYFLNESKNVERPNSAPSSNVLEKPIWSTFNAFQGSLTQDKIIEFASNITGKGYSISQLEISDGYSDKYGDMAFSTDRFPDIASAIRNQINLNVTATVHPFINYDSSRFTVAISNGSFYPGQSLIQGDDVILVKWWNGYGAIVNYLDEKTRVWQKNQTESFLKSNGLSSLKFDGGTDTHIPNCVYVENMTSPVQYTQQYVDFVARQPYSSTAVVSVGYFSQRHPLLFRLLDRNTSLWGLDNGLHSVLTATLSLGMAGYPFVHPGRNGGEDNLKLYIRWLQLTAFLPVMEISYPPWKFNQTIEEHVKLLIKLHKEVYHNYTKQLVADKDYPIVRPLWWVEPNNPEYRRNNDQFLVGNKLLVVPILHESTGDRTVLIPAGKWKCISSYCAGKSKLSDQLTGPRTETVSVSGLFNLLYYKLCDNNETTC